MKSSYLIPAGLLAAACSTQMLDEAAPVPAPMPASVTFKALQEGGSATRTILDEDLVHVLWTPQDAINLFYQDQSARFESINLDDNTDVAQFTGQLQIDVVTGGNEGSDLEPSYFYGLYPYAEDALFDAEKGYIETTLPYKQEAANNSFADDLFITMGRSTSWSMPFYNVCSGMRFTVDQEGVSTVTLRSNDGSPLAGRFLAGFDPETQRPAVVEYIGPCYSEIRLTPPEGDDCFHPGVYYYIVTLPGTHPSGITLELEGLPNPAFVKTSSPVTFRRSRFLPTDLTAERYYADILPLESIDLDIENAGVRGFLEDENIDSVYGEDTAYGYSGVSDYLSAGSDKPNPVRFNWKTTGARTLTVWDSVSETTVFEEDASGLTTEIYNLIPGKKYTYSVNSDELSWKSTITPVGPLRMIQANTQNFRDLGGWTGEDGKTLAYGKLYRGAQISGSDLELFRSLGIGVDLDLRGKPGSPGAVFDASVIIWANIQVYQFMYNGSSSGGGGGGPSGSSSPGYTEELYRQALKYVIDCLRDGKIVYFHCIGGADRTGTLAFLIEALLGVREADMSKEYELTSFYQKRLRNDSGDRPFKQLVFYLKTFPGETLQEQVTSWATTGENALSVEDIDLLKSLMLE